MNAKSILTAVLVLAVAGSAMAQFVGSEVVATDPNTDAVSGLDPWYNTVNWPDPNGAWWGPSSSLHGGSFWQANGQVGSPGSQTLVTSFNLGASAIGYDIYLTGIDMDGFDTTGNRILRAGLTQGSMQPMSTANMTFADMGWGFERWQGYVGHVAAGPEGVVTLYVGNSPGDGDAVYWGAAYVENAAPADPVRTWALDSSGGWSEGRNWDVLDSPNANTHTAVFGSAITSPRVVYAETDVTVREVRFDNASASYAITGHGTVTIESDDPGTNPSKVEVLSGDHEFQAKVALNNDAEVSVADTYTLSMNNQLSLGGNTLTKTGAGTLSINNDLNTGGGSVVGLAGTITGSGTVGGNLTNTSATVAPGNSPGTLTVTGDFSQAGGGTLAIELAGTSDGEFDVLEVVGMASLGGSLDITELYTPGGADTWTILTAGGGITGTFDQITAGYQVALANGDTELVLSLSGALLPGDANGDGCVDDLDLTALAVHWQQSTNLWENGDFNGDGIVDDLDLTALAVNWQQGCGGGGNFADAVAAANVPEPASALVMLLGFAGVARRRGRRS